MLHQDYEGQVSFTFDAWTADNGKPYLSVTGHHISSPPGQPQEWTLESDQLAFEYLEGSHSGANLATVLTRVIDRYGLREKAHSLLSLFLSSNMSFHSVAGLLQTMLRTTIPR